MHNFSEVFIPPHCPNANCKYHLQLDAQWRFKRIGTFGRQVAPHRIQRFLCLHCHRSFSTQTFATSYWLKRPDVLPQLLTKTTGCMANRQIARDLHVTPSTIDRQLARLGRHCLLYHAAAMQTAQPAQRVAIDGFVTFEHSQYWPFHHHLAIEPESDFIVYFTDSEVRRSGKMTAAQKYKRERLEAALGRPDPKAVFKDVKHLLEIVAGSQSRLTVLSDDHRAYPQAIKALRCEVMHLVTSSKERRDANNRLFPVNLADLVLRHSSANHKRETIAWSKRRQASAERLAAFLVWRNYMKSRREKQPRGPTPAQARGSTDHRVTIDELLERRLFVSRTRLPQRWVEYYWRDVSTRALPRQRRHDLRYAA
jgi:transposase-like protein